jgi:dienelactone hydrolase
VLRGYLYRAAGEGPRPALVMHNGFDGAAEELHFFGALGGQERGYHVLTFDGPGQPAAIHRDGMVFRPDWENVVGPVLDFLTRDPGVDRDRIALLGVSLGGCLAPRAAAYEPRLAAVVALDAVSALTAHLPVPHEEAARRAAAEHDEAMDRMLADACAQSPIPALGLRPRPLRHQDLDRPGVPGRVRPLQLQGRKRAEDHLPGAGVRGDR